MIHQLLNIVAPVFIIISLGWGWTRLKRSYDSPTITALVMDIGAPCLVFSTLSTLSVSKRLIGQMGLAALITLFTTAVFGFILLKFVKLNIRSFLPPLIFGNIGNMGLPLCYFAFGKEGLALAVVVFSIYAVGTMTIGLWMYSGEKNPIRLLKSPIVYAVFLALLFLMNGVEPPDWILKTTRLLGNFTIPLMLFTLGVSLARLEVTSLKRAIAMSSLRIGLGFGVGLLISHLIGLTGIARGVLLVQSSMPVAVFNYLLAERYNRNSKEIAELVFMSTLISLLTTPLIIRFFT